MNSKNRITYRFDRTGQNVSQDNNKEDGQFAASSQQGHVDLPQPSNKSGASSNVVPFYNHNSDSHPVSEFSPWNSPFQEDVGALEKLIRNTDQSPTTKLPFVSDRLEGNKAQDVRHMESMLHSHSISNSNSNTDSDAVDTLKESRHVFVDTDAPHPRPIKRYSTPPSWMNVFLSVAGALATGALFGYLLLSLFTGNAIWSNQDGNQEGTPVSGVISNGNKDKVDPNQDVNAPGLTEDIGSSDNKETSALAMVNLTINPQTYHMVQYGVFSHTEGQDAAIAELEAKGLAAAGLKTEQDYRVYTGIAGERSRAVALSKQMIDMEVYVKQVDIEVPQRFPFAGEASSAEKFFNSTSSLISILDDLTLTQLEQSTLSPLSAAAAEAWKSEHQKWTQNVKAMQNGVTDAAGKAFLIKLIQSVNSAAKSLVEYDKSPIQSHLWSVQSAIMESVVTQKEWFESIRAL
ncbi:MAG: hypothetical protein ACE3L7_31385 [Candidatus Pristimantibacillus sp.]